jgi:plasmid stabilization system protein ParE
MTMLEALSDTKTWLSNSPLLGSNRYATLLTGVRFVLIGRFPLLAFYVIEGGSVSIIRAIYERRNIPPSLNI